MRRTRMFAMHERTRRLICRFAFLAICLLPTASMVTSVCIVRSSFYQASRRAAWQRTLSDQWGLIVTLDQVSTPRRNLTLLDGLELSDPETGEPIASVRQVEIGYNGKEMVVVVAQPEVQGDQFLRFWEAFHERFLRNQATAPSQVSLFAGELTIQRSKDVASTLSDVRCRMTSTADGPQATFEFRDVALKMAEPAQLRVTRNRQISPPATRWELNTQSTALPCSLLAEYLPALQWMGEEAAFQGTVDATRSGRGWQGELAGRFRDVELDRLVTDRFDHKLSGSAEILFRRATFADGKLTDAAGDVSCSGGVVSRSLLAQAGQTLGLIADARVRSQEADTLWRYSDLRFGFSIGSEGLQLVGHCQDSGEGVVMADTYGPLLTDEPQKFAKVVALVQTLASPTGEQVPASAEAYQLLHVLPIPDNSRDRASVATPGPLYIPLRMQ